MPPPTPPAPPAPAQGPGGPGPDRGDRAAREPSPRDAHDVLRRHVESTPLALVEWDGDYRVTGFSRRAEELFGFAAAEVVGRRIDEIPWVPEEDWPKVRGVMRDMGSGERATNVSANRNVRKDGSVIHCEWYNSALHDASGRLVSMLSLVLDVTHRVRLERDLRRHGELLHLAHDAVMTWTREGGIESWNVGAEELYGYPADEAVGRETHTLLETGFPAPWPEIERTLRTEGRWSGELRHTCKDGRVLTVASKMQLVRGEDGVDRVLEATHDLTALKEALARAEWLARLPQENPDPVLRLAGDSTVLFANAAARRDLGAVVGAPAPERLAETARRVARTGGRDKVELEAAGRVFSASFVPVGPEVEEINVYAQDITGRRRADEALRRSVAELVEAQRALREADRRKDQFLAILSHELRNPLAPIRNAVHLLEHTPPGGEAAGRALEVLRRQAEHLTRLVDDLLDVTRVTHGKIELRIARVDAREVVRRACADARGLFEQRPLELQLEEAAEPLWVDADPVRLAQMVGNLLANALKFTPPGGRVRVAARRRGGDCELSVSDTGQGLEPGDLERIFEPFVQAEPTRPGHGGMGLGLALVRELAARQGGAARAASDGPGRGAEFVVTLPLAAPPPVAAGRGADGPGAAAVSVLIVEDNEDAAATLADLLTLRGNRVTTVHTGRAGVEAAATQRPDVLVCDVGLPDMSGHDVIRAVRAARPAHPLFAIALSGFSQPRDREQALAAGFDAHLPKPAPLEELEALLRAAAGARG